MSVCIPKDLQPHFKRKQFKISLKSGRYNLCKRLSLYLNDCLKEIYQEIRMGKKVKGVCVDCLTVKNQVGVTWSSSDSVKN